MTLQHKTQKLQTRIQTHSDFNTMTEEQISPIYQDFIDCLTDHNHLYYIDSAPIIADREYDELFDYLKKIEEYFPHIISSNSPTQWLVGQVNEWFTQAKHTTPQLSLENSYNEQDLIEWDEFIHKHLSKDIWTTPNYSYILEPKFDWISVELIYKSWLFQQAITRGDGITGDDITTNVKTIKNIPHRISDTQEIHLRWEIMMPKSVRKNINQQREKNWEYPFANTRNAAAWSIKLLDISQVAKRWLICYVYDRIVSDQDNNIQTHEQSIQHLKDLWLPVFDRHKKYNNIQEVIQTILDPQTQQFFQTQDNDFDGLVLKVNEIQNRKILWATQHHPRRAIAYKFPAQQISTQIISVDRQVGRSGVITPVANLTPVQLSWVTISRVSLHNIDFINTKDIQLHDYVWVQRSGEVIPYIVWVIKERRDNTQKITPPTHCPSCWHQTNSIDMHTYCTNHACPAQLQEKIEHFVSKQCMDIEGIGKSIAEILIKHDIIRTVDQLYTFTTPEKQALLRSLPWFADKKVAEIVKQLELSKTKPLRRLIHWLWIPNIGKKTAMMIQDTIQQKNNNKTLTIETLIAYLTNPEFLEQIYGIGEKMIVALQAFFHDTTNITILQNIINAGINIQPLQSNQNINNPFTGQHFAITGTFPVAREQIITACESQGMIFDASPTKQSQYMLIGDNPWSKKAKAEQYNIPLITWRTALINTFPFLNAIIPTQNSNKPVAQSLF